MIIEIAGALGLALLVVMAQSAHRRESLRVAPGAVPSWTPSFEVPDVGFYDLAASRIRPETLYEIEKETTT